MDHGGSNSIPAADCCVMHAVMFPLSGVSDTPFRCILQGIRGTSNAASLVKRSCAVKTITYWNAKLRRMGCICQTVPAVFLKPQQDISRVDCISHFKLSAVLLLEIINSIDSQRVITRGILKSYFFLCFRKL